MTDQTGGPDRPVAVLAGLSTLDIVQLVARYPADNEKITAEAQTIAAGGPATNAAATFAYLGGAVTLLTGVGRHPLAAGITADLSQLGVRLVDLAADDPAPPTVSSIVVSVGSGNRAVVSTNAGVRHLALPDLKPVLAGADVVQVDGHYPELAAAVLAEARRQGVPTLIDAGSWKPTMPDLVTMLDVVVCSADFRPPGTSTPYEIASFLADRGVRWIAVTQGAGPTLRWTGDGFVEQPVPRTRVVDTLGAGDVFHGALTFAVAQRWPLTDEAFAAALDTAGVVASRSCAYFGTRTWMTAPARDDGARPG